VRKLKAGVKPEEVRRKLALASGTWPEAIERFRNWLCLGCNSRLQQILDKAYDLGISSIRERPLDPAICKNEKPHVFTSWSPGI